MTISPELVPLIPIVTSALSAVVTSWVVVRKQATDDQASLFQSAQQLHKDCEEKNKRLEDRIHKLERFLFPELPE